MDYTIKQHWKPVPGFGGFYASDQGQIRRDGWTTERGRQMQGYVLKPHFIDGKQTAPWRVATGPYYRCRPDGGKPIYVAGAILVAMAWLDFAPNKGDCINFVNDQATDIRLSNLVIRPKAIANMVRRLNRHAHAQENFQTN